MKDGLPLVRGDHTVGPDDIKVSTVLFACAANGSADDVRARLEAGARAFNDSTDAGALVTIRTVIPVVDGAALTERIAASHGSVTAAVAANAAASAAAAAKRATAAATTAASEAFVSARAYVRLRAHSA